MRAWSCPVCREALVWEERRAVCGNGHAFDRSKEGYVNLLPPRGPSAKRHGDDRLMLSARQRFLSGGHYGFLLEAVSGAVERHLANGGTILDVGCGEGYYTAGLHARLNARGFGAELMAVDISKAAAKLTAKRDFPKETAVASAYALPVRNGSCDVVLNIFAPIAAAEFARVLKPEGVLIRVVPRERHLFGLKRLIYDKPCLNPPAAQDLEGFRPVEALELDRRLVLTDPEDIEALFQMTPYYYKTSAEDQARAKAVDTLETELSFAVFVDRRADAGAFQ